MLRSVNDLQRYSIEASDGKLGHVHEFLFDDIDWVVRYLVVDTGKFLPGRQVLISPVTIVEPDWKSQRLKLRLSKKEIENSPHISVDQPVSRQHEYDLATYYDWPAYWPGGAMGIPPEQSAIQKMKDEAEKAIEEGDPNLRSVKEVVGYNVEATDGEVGVIDDFIVQDDIWTLRYLTVDTRKWLHWLPGGKRVMLSPTWIKYIQWSKSTVYVDMDRESIKNSPEFDPLTPINRNYEVKLYDFYGRPVYW